MYMLRLVPTRQPTRRLEPVPHKSEAVCRDCVPPIPENVKREVSQRAQHRCEDCGRDDVRLELHHLRYQTEPGYKGETDYIFGRETPHDLALLCRDCHHHRHVDRNGEFWADPEEKATYWATFD
jgi:5-methylcytosine-specific restriction endonuclease McrA